MSGIINFKCGCGKNFHKEKYDEKSDEPLKHFVERKCKYITYHDDHMFSINGRNTFCKWSIRDYEPIRIQPNEVPDDIVKLDNDINYLIEGDIINFNDNIKVSLQRTYQLKYDPKVVHELPCSVQTLPIISIGENTLVAPIDPTTDALWINFSGVGYGNRNKSGALKVCSGYLNALTGHKDSDVLTKQTKNETRNHCQNYMTLETQPWLDGFNSGKGVIRQFVPTPMEHSIEENKLGGEGKSVKGGLTFKFYPKKKYLLTNNKFDTEKLTSYDMLLKNYPLTTDDLFVIKSDEIRLMRLNDTDTFNIVVNNTHFIHSVMYDKSKFFLSNDCGCLTKFNSFSDMLNSQKNMTLAKCSLSNVYRIKNCQQGLFRKNEDLEGDKYGEKPVKECDSSNAGGCGGLFCDDSDSDESDAEYGFKLGAQIKQKIYPDTNSVNSYTKKYLELTIKFVSRKKWKELTGKDYPILSGKNKMSYTLKDDNKSDIYQGGFYEGDSDSDESG